MTQIHYTAWPDHGVPDNVMSIISFIRQVRKLFPVTLDQPLLVHCSAGVGRTGTFITLDMMMQQMKAEATLSVYQCVRDLRIQRMQMVQTMVCVWKILICCDIYLIAYITKLNLNCVSYHNITVNSTTQAQYVFIHKALSELLVCGETEVTASNLGAFTDTLNGQLENSGMTGSQKHFQVHYNFVVALPIHANTLYVTTYRSWSVLVQNMRSALLVPGHETMSAKTDIVTYCPVSIFQQMTL